MEKNIKKFQMVGLFFLFLLGLFLRTQYFLTGNFFFLFDQGRDLLEVEKILSGKLTLIGPHTGMQGIFHGPLWFYLLSFLSLLSGGHPGIIGALMALFHVLLVALGSFFIAQLSGFYVGFIFYFLMLFSPRLIGYSQYLWNPNIIPYLIPFYIIPIIIFLKGKAENIKWWFFLGLITGVITQFELAFGFLFPLVILLFILVNFNLRFIYYFLYFLFGYFLTFLPQIIFELRHQFLMTNSILSLLKGESRGLGGQIFFPERLFYRLNELKIHTIDSFSEFFLLNIFIFFLLIFIIIFSRTKWERKRRGIVSLFLISVFVFLAVFLIYPYSAWSYYWIGFPTLYLFLISFFFGKTIETSSSRAKKILSFVLLFSIVFIVKNGFKKVVFEGSGIFKNEIETIDWVYQNAQGKPFSVFVFTPPIYDYTYQYLFKWYGSEKYNFIPEKEKSGLIYLIIEPFPEKPWESIGWKKTYVEIEGEPEERVELSGGIVVEKYEK